IIDAFGWRISFIFQGGLYLLLILPTLFYPYTIHPKDNGLLPYGYNENNKVQEPEAQNEENNLSLSEILQTKSAIIIFIALLIFTISFTLISGITQHLPG
ncbi:hypothetical protein, partial [Salmonella enterica]|uniref:hypothetical protein n=1 Tax=Salmonella enterica TaxID=28901 RepID=UPI000CC3E9C6